MKTSYSTGTALHWIARKWWMRTRPCVASITSEGIGGASEFYCPLWAWPLDLMHAALFGRTTLAG